MKAILQILFSGTLVACCIWAFSQPIPAEDINKTSAHEIEGTYQVITKPEQVSGLSTLKKVFVLALSSEDYKRTVMIVFTDKEYAVGTKVKIAWVCNMIHASANTSFPVIVMPWK